MNTETILEKVKKLLALANNAGATEGERDNALRMAHNLLLKHNLDMNDLEQHCAIEGREEFTNATYGMKWCRDISNQVAKLFFCTYYCGRKINSTKIEHHFVGKVSNVATAALMSEFVITSILSECRKRWKHNLAPESRSFAYGAAQRIRERVAQLLREAETQTASPGTSLVVKSLYESEQAANEAFIQAAGTQLVTKKSRTGAVNVQAYGAGKEFGDKISLNTQVANRNQLKLESK